MELGIEPILVPVRRKGRTVINVNQSVIFAIGYEIVTIVLPDGDYAVIRTAHRKLLRQHFYIKSIDEEISFTHGHLPQGKNSSGFKFKG